MDDHIEKDIKRKESLEKLKKEEKVKKVDEIVEKFTPNEDRSTGTISWSIFHIYAKNVGGYITLFSIFLICLFSQFFIMYSSKFLEDWSSKFKEEKAKKYDYLKQYAFIWLLGTSLGFVRKIIETVLSYYLSTRIHSRMMHSLLHSKMQAFLDVVPYGRIQNRFSKDISNLDKQAVSYFTFFIDGSSVVLILFATIGYSIGYEMIILMVIWVIFVFYLERRYMNAKREYARILAISKTPLINTASDTMKGLVVIRTLGIKTFFKEKFFRAIDSVLKNTFIDRILMAWFNLRISFSGQFIIQLPALLGILFYFENLTSANIGLFFLCIFQMVESLGDFVSLKTEFEASMISVERCVFFTKLESENGYKTLNLEKKMFGYGGEKRMKRLLEREKMIYDEERIRKKLISENKEINLEKRRIESVITKGELEFRNVSAKYLTSEKNVLKNLDFRISPGEKIGVVGRTGSGKSSLLKLIWRYMDPSNGVITIDGKNIKEVDSKALRSQMTVITQETSLFEGTLRENLDPSGFKFSDGKLEEIMDKLEFKHKAFIKEKLDMEINSDGTNLSQGERQLICFARSILDPSRLILLDEATASIDIKTEEVIQKSIKEFFEESTMIIVAHRVQTVMECDRILVLEMGEVVEFDKPDVLLKKEGFFKEIVEKMREQ